MLEIIGEPGKRNQEQKSTEWAIDLDLRSRHTIYTRIRIYLVVVSLREPTFLHTHRGDIKDTSDLRAVPPVRVADISTYANPSTI